MQMTMLLWPTQKKIYRPLNAFARAYKLLGLMLNIKKTQVLHQPPPDTLAPLPKITIANEGLENVDHFPYLGSYLSSKADIDSEIQYCCASGVCGALLYGAETWTTYSRHLRALESYHQRHLREILRATWEEKRTNICILDDANIHSINTTIRSKHQLRWTGHVIRMPDTGLPKQVIYS